MTDRSKSNPEQEKNKEKTGMKKAYHRPHLEVYGSLTGLTNGNGGPYIDGSSNNSSMNPPKPLPPIG